MTSNVSNVDTALGIYNECIANQRAPQEMQQIIKKRDDALASVRNSVQLLRKQAETLDQWLKNRGK